MSFLNALPQPPSLALPLSPPLSSAFSSYPYTLCLLLPFFGNVCLLTGSKQIVFGPCIACRGLLQLINIISHSYEFRLLSKVQAGRGRGRNGTWAGAGSLCVRSQLLCRLSGLGVAKRL